MLGLMTDSADFLTQTFERRSTLTSVSVLDEARIRELKALCEQAERLRKDAEKLCRQLAVQIERSRAAHQSARPSFVERRVRRK